MLELNEGSVTSVRKVTFPPIHQQPPYMEVTIKNTLSMLKKAGFKLKEALKVLPLRHNEALTPAPAYIFIAKKRMLSSK